MFAGLLLMHGSYQRDCHTSSGTITTFQRTDDYEQHPWNFLDIQSFVPEMKLFHKNDTPYRPYAKMATIDFCYLVKFLQPLTMQHQKEMK